MTITLAAVAGDAWGRWRRDRGLLLALAGPFLFLPVLAWLLLMVEPAAPPADADNAARSQILLTWAQANFHWLAARIGVELYGAVAILGLYLSRAHRDVGGLLRTALTLLPGFAAASLLGWGLIGLGSFAFVLPGLYLYGRLGLTGPVYVAESGVGVFGALGRSFALTRGHGWQLFGYLALPLLAGLLAAQLTGGLTAGMEAAGAVNPVAVAILDGLAAAALAATGLARLLLEVELYRRLVR